MDEVEKKVREKYGLIPSESKDEREQPRRRLWTSK